MLFEKVLRRLCPCYYARSDENEVLCAVFDERRDHSIENPDTAGRFTGATVSCIPNEENDGANESFTAADYWGGSYDLIHPQPLYALPCEKNEFRLENKNLLTPPLYWKKTIRSFGSKGPPVVQERKKRIHRRREERNAERRQKLLLKHSETIADVRSITSEKNPSSWFRSRSFHDLHFDVSASRENNEEATTTRNKAVECRRDWECFARGGKKFKVIPDISYGVIVFSAAYHSLGKLLLLKIDRLENLSLKGRNGSTYATIIKLSVSPSNKFVKCTKVLKKSTSPDVKEDFSFTVKEIAGKVLRMSVFDTLSQNTFHAVGHALLSLDGVMTRHPKRFRMKLYRHTQPHVTPGNLALSLGYRPEEDKFTVLVDKAKNLILQRDRNVRLNTYVKGTLYSRGAKLKSKKSHMVMNSKDPNYNSTFTFRVKEDDVEDLLIVIAVRLKSFVKDATIGRVILGPFFVTDHKKLTPWGRVFLRREFVSHWFRLYL